jgi:hypothetical protein
MTDLVRVSRGLWRPAGALTTLADKAATLLRVCPPGTVLAGMTAARLHELWLPLSDWRIERIEVIVRPEINPQQLRSYSRRAELRARRQQLLPDEVTDINGLPVCTEARCWLDLAARLRPADVVALGDSALRGAASVAEIEALLGEPDLSYDDVRLAIEYNGALHAKVDRMRKDITRELDIELRGGWRSVVFGPSEVLDNPDVAVAHVSRLRHTLSTALLSGHLDR